MGGASSSGEAIEVCCLRFMCGTMEIGGRKQTGTADGRICKYLPRDFPGQITPDLPRIFFLQKKTGGAGA